VNKYIAPWGKVLLLATSLLFYGGCGGSDGPPVSGTVVLDGQTIQNGVILFTPDLDAGNDGPMATVMIRDGRFSSGGADAPVVPGAHLARVLFPPQDGGGEETVDIEYEIHLNIPEGGQTDLTIDLSEGTRQN